MTRHQMTEGDIRRALVCLDARFIHLPQAAKREIRIVGHNIFLACFADDNGDAPYRWYAKAFNQAAAEHRV